jgi:hypothetical protein
MKLASGTHTINDILTDRTDRLKKTSSPDRSRPGPNKRPDATIIRTSSRNSEKSILQSVGNDHGAPLLN